MERPTHLIKGRLYLARRNRSKSFEFAIFIQGSSSGPIFKFISDNKDITFWPPSIFDIELEPEVLDLYKFEKSKL